MLHSRNNKTPIELVDLELNTLVLNIIGNDEIQAYCIKKGRRYASAIFLATAHIKDTNPIKKELRERALSCVVFFNNSGFGDIERAMFEILSFLEVAAISGDVSYENVALLRREGRLFIEVSASIFVTGEETEIRTLQSLLSDVRRKSNDNLSNERAPREASKVREKSAVKARVTPLAISARARRGRHSDAILSALVPDKQYQISEIIPLLRDISSKTLQRELAALVEGGQLKKEGSRRWSTYIRPRA
ncbi:MAG: hypothetical protein Q8Q18_02060 [bacterium]|nr:hypothetical protein [bacterium]